MKTNKWLIGLLCFVSLALVIKGCNRDHDDNPTAPAGSQTQGFALQFVARPNVTQKAVGLRIDVTGQNERNEPAGPPIEPITIANPKFPLQVNLALFKPPCRYRLLVTTTLERDPTVAWSTMLNICQNTSGTIIIDPYEVPIVRNLSIAAPDAAQAGQTIEAMCQAEGVNAPDSDRYPVELALVEQGGVELPAVQNTLQIAGSFPDPYPLSSSQGSRTLICTIGDRRTLVQTVQKSIVRIVPTPTPLPTPIIIVPTPSFALAVTANAAPPAIELGETSVITAQVSYQGNPVAGATVNFAHTQGLGTLNPAVATSDAMGLASSTFSAGTTPGLATIYISATAPQGTALTDTTVAIAVPTPTVTPTLTPTNTPTVGPGTPTNTPLPTATPTPPPTNTPTITPTPTVTPTPTPIPGCVVANNSDGVAPGPVGSLRYVLANAVANGCTTITFVPGVTNITLTSGVLTIASTTGTLTIDGGAAKVTVSGNYSSRVFTVNSGASVVFENLVISNGNDGTGGGIYNQGTVTIGSGTSVRNNSLRGIYNTGTLIVNGIVEFNTSTGTGGGIVSTGPLTINGGVENNTANSYGGGIQISGATLIINSTGVVRNNVANSASGGGIYGTGQISIYGTVENNNAGVGGGGLNLTSTATTVTIYGTVEGNHATTYGGGIYTASATVIVETGGRVENNTSDNMGGGIWGGTITIRNGGVVNGNTAARGGGIGGCDVVTIETGGVVEDNTATSTYGGGGIWGFDMLAVNGIIRNNQALSGTGGGVYASNSTIVITGIISGNRANEGGGIYNWFGSTLNVNGSVEGNQATNRGGGIFNGNGSMVNLNAGNLIQNNTASDGGGIYNAAGITGTPNYGAGNTPNNCAGTAVPGICPNP